METNKQLICYLVPSPHPRCSHTSVSIAPMRSVAADRTLFRTCKHTNSTVLHRSADPVRFNLGPQPLMASPPGSLPSLLFPCPKHVHSQRLRLWDVPRTVPGSPEGQPNSVRPASGIPLATFQGPSSPGWRMTAPAATLGVEQDAQDRVTQCSHTGGVGVLLYLSFSPPLLNSVHVHAGFM